MSEVKKTTYKKPDMSKILAMLSQKPDIPPLPENVTEERVEISYITKDGLVEQRPIKIFLPKSSGEKLPLVYVAHYEINRDSAELVEYLENGWAVSSVSEFVNEYNAELADDDLVFNNAALYYLAHRPEIDRERIAVTGGSAGGYMTTMLAGLRLDICCAAAKGVPANLWFNFREYAPYVSRINMNALLALSEEERKDIPNLLTKLPIPFAAVFGYFQHEEPEEDQDTRIRRYLATSPLGVAPAISCPYVETHNTSDVLVPLDQITHKFVYEKPGESLPADHKLKLADFDMPREFTRTFDEVLPAELTETVLLPFAEMGNDEDLYFSKEKPFTIAIYDEGAPESYGSHGTNPGGMLSDAAFIRVNFEKTRKNTVFLNEEKAQMLLTRYAGRSIALPAHTGIHDEVYGSLAVYRKEVREFLQNYREDHPDEDAAAILMKAAGEDPVLQTAAKEL